MGSFTPILLLFSEENKSNMELFNNVPRKNLKITASSTYSVFRLRIGGAGKSSALLGRTGDTDAGFRVLVLCLHPSFLSLL